MKSGKPVMRRTLSQERFEVLRKKQSAGTATFKDLTELDEIVNRDPDIRFSILEEMQEESGPDNSTPELPLRQPIIKVDFPKLVQQFIGRLFRFAAQVASPT